MPFSVGSLTANSSQLPLSLEIALKCRFYPKLPSPTEWPRTSNWLILEYEGPARLPQFSTSLKGATDSRPQTLPTPQIHFRVASLSAQCYLCHILIHVSHGNTLHKPSAHNSPSQGIFFSLFPGISQLDFVFYVTFLLNQMLYLLYIPPFNIQPPTPICWNLSGSRCSSPVFAIFLCFVSLANLIRMLSTSSSKSLMEILKTTKLS